MRCYATETMTCVGRYVGADLLLNGKAFHYAAYRDGVTADLYITAGWADETDTSDIGTYLRLITADGNYEFSAADGWDDPVCRIAWSTDPAQLFIRRRSSGYTISSDGVSVDQVQVRLKRYNTLPVFSMEPVFYANYSHELTWTLEPKESRSGWVTGIVFFKRAPGEESFTSRALWENTRLATARLTLLDTILGKEVYLNVEYRTYPANWDGTDLEDFVTLNCFATPVQLVDRDGSVPLQPEGIGTTLLIDGGKVTVSWAEVQDPIYPDAAYYLERAGVDEAGTLTDFTRLYEGSAVRFRDTLPAGLTAVNYRVCTAGTAGAVSPWTETGMAEIARSNIYVGKNGRWNRAAAVTIGGRKASPMVTVL